MESSNDDSERSATSSDVSCSHRPNRFKGPKSTWRKLTIEERLVATSMTKLRDQDLSIHLYNAHAMRWRHYDANQVAGVKPWAGKVSFLVITISTWKYCVLILVLRTAG